MKKLLLTGAALVGLTAGVLGQGSFALDGSFINNGVADISQGNWYSGALGVEVWMLNGTTIVPAGLNALALVNASSAYTQLTTDGFKLETTLAGKSANGGLLTLGEVHMADVAPAASSVVVALAAWNSAAASWSAAAPTAHFGVIAFPQATANYNAVPPPVPAPLGWGAVSQDLVLMPIPEPSTFALVGLGAAALLIFRRRK